MIFDYVNSALDNNPRVCLIETFRTIVSSSNVKELIQRFRAGDAEAKKHLPAFLFHATFGGKKRLAQNAEASGAVMVDFDKLPEPELKELCARIIQASQQKENGIMLAHITPSGKGIRIVIRAHKKAPYEQCDTIGDFQHRIAEIVGATQYLDEVTTDLSRLSFAPQKEDIFVYTSELFGSVKEVDFKETDTRQRPTQQTTAVFTSGSSQDSFEGVPLSDIFKLYFETEGGVPTEGNRNAAFYKAARDLRYICDFNPNVIARAMPEVGLTQKEVLDVCTSACQSSRAAEIPLLVRSCVNKLKDSGREDDEQEAPESETENHVKLPPIFEHFTSCYPPSFRDAVVLAMLPCLGTLATRVRARYLDGELHSPSFFTVVSAEQASGKSFARKIVNILMEDLKSEDDAARAIEQAYRNQVRQSKNKKNQPDDPRVVIRCVPANVSVAKLLQRLDYAEGRHIFSFAEEMDTVIKANSGGSWSQKSDIYRNAFDNAEYGQDYMSDNSYSANLRIFYNLLILGTPRQVDKFFNDVENGLVSRCMFASLPDGFAQRMPIFKDPTPDGVVFIKKFINRLREAKNVIEIPEVNEVLDAWLEKQRLLALQSGDRARDTFRKRAAVMAFRAAMVVAAGYERRKAAKKVLQDFALYIADMVLREQMVFAAARMDEAFALNSESRSARKSRGENRRETLFQALPESFSANDITSLAAKSLVFTPTKQLVYLWRKNGLIERTSNGSFRKINPNQPTQ